LSFAIIGESHGTGVGTGAFAGATGLAAGGVAGAVTAAFAGGTAALEADFSAGALASDCTEPELVGFTPPATAGLSAVGFGSPSGGGEEGDLISSGMAANAQTSGFQRYEENVNFYQLEHTVSTSLRALASAVASLGPRPSARVDRNG